MSGAVKTADIAALVFELQRTSSPVERARVLARAWRTIRGLDPVERRLLAREVGFDGAEELLEGLAGRGAGGLAPAALLEALNRARRDEGLSMRSLVSALRDPGRRDELMARGMDLAAELVEEGAEREEEARPASPPPLTQAETPEPAAGAGVDDETPDGEAEADEPIATAGVRLPPVGEKSRAGVPAPKPPSAPVVTTRPSAGVFRSPAVGSPLAPDDALESSAAWEVLWHRREPPLTLPDARAADARAVGRDGDDGLEPGCPGSFIERLRELRLQLSRNDRVSSDPVSRVLEGFPDGWARRRAVLAVIEAATPGETSAVLDLIETLGHGADRSWCLTALARRGELAGDNLDRALSMLSSPAARRRVRGLSRTTANRSTSPLPVARPTGRAPGP